MTTGWAIVPLVYLLKEALHYRLFWLLPVSKVAIAIMTIPERFSCVGHAQKQNSVQEFQRK